MTVKPLNRVAQRYWIFTNLCGSLIHVERAKFPTLVSAMAEARKHLANG